MSVTEGRLGRGELKALKLQKDPSALQPAAPCDPKAGRAESSFQLSELRWERNKAMALRTEGGSKYDKAGERGLAPSGPVIREDSETCQEAAAHQRGLASVASSLPPYTPWWGNGRPPDANPTGWLRFRLGSGMGLGERGGRLRLSVLSLPAPGAPRVTAGRRPGL